MACSPDVGSNIDHATNESDRASLKVFNTAELLEKILLELPMVDLVVRIPRVSKVFKATIDGSIQLRRALFLEPTAPSDHEGDIRLNPLLLSPRFINSLGVSIRHPYRLLDDYIIIIFPHQPPHRKVNCIQFEKARTELDWFRGSKQLRITIQVRDGEQLLVLDTNDPITPLPLGYSAINKGSWKQMFLTQPPIAIL
jgi:hypothetical protein